MPAIDFETLIRFRKGDENAFSLIHRRLLPVLLYHGRRLVSDPFVAETVVQDSFLRLWTFRNRMISEQHVYRFLRLVTRWGCYAYYRSGRQQFQRSCILYSEHMDRRPYPLELSHLKAQLRTEERLQLIDRVLPYLTPTRQNILTLHFRYGFEVRQIAARMGRTEAAVRKELNGGVEHLQKMLHRPRSAKADSATGEPSLPLLADPQQPGGQQQQVFALRRQYKWGFDRIAQTLNLQPSEVHRLYIQACTGLHQPPISNKPPCTCTTPISSSC